MSEPSESSPASWDARVATLVGALLSVAVRAAGTVWARAGQASNTTKVPALVDAGFELTMRGAVLAARGAGRMARLGRPLVEMVLQPQPLPHRMWPQTRLDALAD